MDTSELERLRAYEALLEAGPGFVAVSDLQGRMLFVSTEGRDVVGVPADADVASTTLDDYLVPSDSGGDPQLRDWRDGGLLALPVHSFEVLDVTTGHAVARATVQRDLRQMQATEAAERAHAALEENEQRYQTLLQHISDLIVVVDRSGRLQYASPSARRVLGYEQDAELAASVLDVVHPQDREAAARALQAIVDAQGVSAPAIMQLRTVDGVRQFEVVANNLLDDPAVGGVVCVSRDVTQRVRAEQAQVGQAQLLELIAGETPLEKVLAELAYWVEDQLEHTACSILLSGREQDDVLVLRNGASPSMPEQYREAVAASAEVIRCSPCASAAATGAPVLVADLLADDRWRPLHTLAADLAVRSCWSYPITSPATGEVLGTFALYRPEPGLPDEAVNALMGRASHLVGIAVDRERLLTRLAHQAHHDALTGLPNRLALLGRLEEALRRREQGGPSPVVVFLDLDRLKVVNDSLGHEVGDELLVQVARRLRAAVPPEDTVARFGGDEFVVLCARPGCEDQAVAVVETVLRAVAEVVPLEGRQVTPSASAGVVIASAEATASEVLRDADIAMYRAKHRRAGGYEVFGEHMRQRAFDRLDLEEQIRSGIARGEFRLHYQPIVDLQESSIVGFEALVRWQHPERGLLGPADFIDLAEETGLILPLGEWVLRTAVDTAMAWRRRSGSTTLTMSVNLAAQQLAAPGLADLVQDCKDRLAPWSLGLEFTESTMMDDTVATRSVLDALARTGAWLSIDDFGTGYSSLAYLTRLPVRQLKIDREFIGDLERKAAVTVASAIIGLGDELGLTIVAEGVETEAQRETLLAMGCRYAQGYLLGRPVPEQEALALLLAQDEGT